MNKNLKIIIGIVVMAVIISSVVYITFNKNNNKSNKDKGDISVDTNKSTDGKNNTSDNIKESDDKKESNETKNKEDKPQNNNDAKPESNKESDQVDNDKSALIEESITSFNMIFKNMVNNKDLNIDFLKDVVEKDSKAYSDVKALIDGYRESNTKVEKMEFSLDSVKKVEENIYQATVKTDEIRSINNQSKNEKKEIIYKVKLVDGAKIIEISNLN
ncbi:hypothetical protein [Clostridium sp. 'White wine YQ']|uniref:hypothetical protein n=1 Tax=Clostridium sp. 'White wine YQ' TaxID=3027474 RepID=UPI0023658BBF|nr:hypothetical protein [Clostridium sp. 'White wine YQ']MDD7792735.1 hypothetical protein [Clostridium sp. 'White wine YQ']